MAGFPPDYPPPRKRRSSGGGGGGALLKVIFGAAAFWLILTWLGAGALGTVATFFAKPLFLVVIIIFILIWILRR